MLKGLGARLTKNVAAVFADIINPDAIRGADASMRGRRRRADARAAELKRGAGAGVLAAMIGAQIAEEALANTDDHRSGGLDRLLSRGRLCTGRFGAQGFDDRGASDIQTSAADPHTNHFAPARAPSLSADGPVIFNPTEDFRLTSDEAPFLSGPHQRFGFNFARGFSAPRGRNAEVLSDHSGAGHEGAPVGGRPAPENNQPAGGHNGGGHADGGGADPAPSTPNDSDGGHTGHPTGGAPRALDAAMQADHNAIMALAPVSAATHVAVRDGSWFDPATWANGAVPGEGARVLIPDGVSVDYDGESAASIKTIRVDGALDFATERDTFLEVDTLIVTDSGALTVGTEADPVDADARAVIQFADNGPIDVNWDPRLLSRGLVSMGSIEINGAEKETFLKVAVDPMKGDTTLTLEAPPEGWQVGDKLVLTGTHLVSTRGTPQGAPIDVATEDEELVIIAINGNIVTLDRPLHYDHEGARSDLKAYVANYSRNIVFETENADTTPVHQRGHVMLMHSNDVTVRFAEFTDLGRTDKSERAFDLSDLDSVAPDSNIKGRYSLHIHRSGVDDQANPDR